MPKLETPKEHREFKDTPALTGYGITAAWIEPTVRKVSSGTGKLKETERIPNYTVHVAGLIPGEASKYPFDQLKEAEAFKKEIIEKANAWRPVTPVK